MTTYQGGPTHDGSVNDPKLVGDPQPRWSSNLGNALSYPVIADDRIFVLRRGDSLDGTALFAFEGTTGETIWERSIGGGSNWAALAYEAGRVFVLNADGVLLAVAADDGATQWTTQLPGQYSFSSAPVADRGVVYTGGAGSGGTLYAVSAQTGDVLWTQDVANGDQSSPALSTDSVFVSYACPNVYAFNRASGEPRWKYSTGCSGGGGRTAAFHAGRLYVRDLSKGYVFDASTGDLIDQFSSVTIPALFEDTAIYAVDGNLKAVEIPAGTTRWTFDAEEDLTSAPFVVNSKVYVGSENGTVYGLNVHSGTAEWSSNVGEPIPAPDEHNRSHPLTGFGASDGYLVVPSATKLNVFAVPG